MPRISNSFIIDRLIPALSIEKLIGQFVSLKKSGSNYTCCCPFHHEKTPSFVITPSKQMYYCFGCKEHGNALDFLMKYKNLSFVEAVEEASQFAGLTVEYEAGRSPENYDRYKQYYELMDRVARLYTSTLFSKAGERGLDYFENKRGLSKNTIINCRLGYAPDGWQFLQDQVCKNQNEVDKLVDLGMLVRQDSGRIFSMYRNRVMIPIFDKKGRIISFGGRTLGDDKPKYMNTKETPIYRKRNELFGLFEALRDNKNRPDRLVVVEGYLDVISVRQAGCSVAVASLGTATTPEQFRTMYRYTKKIVCCYDGDEAGRKAAWHALNTVTEVLESDCEIRFAFLPKEHDPDSLVRSEGLGAFTRFLDNAMSYPEFLISHIAKQYDLEDPGQVSIFINDSLTQIKKIRQAPLQSVALNLLAQSSGIDERQLYDMLKSLNVETFRRQIVQNKNNDISSVDDSVEEQNEASSSNILNTPMRRLMAFIFQQVSLVSSQYQNLALKTFGNLCTTLKVRGASELNYVLSEIEKNPGITTATFIEKFRGTNREIYIKSLINAPLGLSLPSGEELGVGPRLEYFARLLALVLLEPLQNRAKYLELNAEHLSKEEFSEHNFLKKQLYEAENIQSKTAIDET